MQDKKILFILHLPPPIHGASMVGQFLVDSDMIKKRFITKHVNLGVTKSLREQKDVSFGKIYHFLKLFKQCLTSYRSYKPDLVYITLASNGLGFYKDALIVLMLKAQGAKLLYHFHNKGIRNHQHKLIDNLLYWYVLRKVEIIITSKRLYPDLKKYVNEYMVHYCHNGIPKIDNELKIRDLNRDNRPTKILFLSNLIETKGVYTLLQACRYLHDRNVNFHCTFIGGEGDITAVELQSKIESLGLLNRVRYEGKKFGDEKHIAFENADIFAFPTHNDCFPLVLLEAMQHSMPIVSTPEGGIPDIVEDNVSGFLVPQNDPECLADKLELLINDVVLQLEMGKKGFEKYQEQFTVGIYEENLAKIFTSVLDKK